MSTHSTNDSSIQTSVGKVVSRVTLTVDGVCVGVIPTSVAAARLHYSRGTVAQMCDEGKLIAVKIDGRWWVLETSVMYLRQSLDKCGVNPS